MTKATVQLLIKVLEDKFDISETLDSSTNLNEVGLDSLDIINFLYSVEEETSVSIPDEDLVEYELETIQQFADYVDARSGQG
jgi:acyl carrier protein